MERCQKTDLLTNGGVEDTVAPEAVHETRGAPEDAPKDHVLAEEKGAERTPTSKRRTSTGQEAAQGFILRSEE